MQTRYILENFKPEVLDRSGDFFLTVENVFFEQGEKKILTVVLRVHDDEEIKSPEDEDAS